MPSSPSSKGGWVCFRTAKRGASRDGVYWHRLAIGGEEKKKKKSRKAKKLHRWFSNDQHSDLCSAVVGLDSYIYTLGGSERVGIFDYASNRVYRCNMSCVDDEELVWERCASMLVARESSRAVVVAGKIFVVGGSTLEHWKTIGSEKWVEVFDPAKGTWEFLPSPVLAGQKVSLYKILYPSSSSSSSRGGGSGGGGIDYSNGSFPISVVVCGSDQILFSSNGSSSYLYNVHDHSLRKSPYFVEPRSLFLPRPNLFDYRAQVEYSFDWEDGSLYGCTMSDWEAEEEDPSTTFICYDSLFEGTLFSPDKSVRPPPGSAVLASFSGHGGVFNGRLHAHALLLEYGDRRDGARTNTLCYKHLVYSETGSSDDGGDLLLRRRIKTDLRFLLGSHTFLIDAIIVGGKSEGSDKRRRLGTEKHKVLVEKKKECSSSGSSGRKRKRGRKDEGSNGIGDMETVRSAYGEKRKRHKLCRKCRSQY